MLQVRVLGELELEVDGRRVEPPASRRARSLLGLLALERRAHARSELAARFWPDVLDESARTSLRSALAGVRRALGADADSYLVAGRERVALSATALTDAQQFEQLVAGGRPAEAIALWRGDLLAGLDDDWVLVARDEWRERAIAVLADLAAAAEAAGDLAGAIGHARRMVVLDSLGEEGQRTLIRLIAAGGDRAGALAAYGRYADRLRAELRIAPSAATRALAEELRAGDATSTAGVPRPAPAEPSARGPLVGRERSLATLIDAWQAARAGRPRVVLVEGDAGIGKSRLLAEFCRRAYADGATVLQGRSSEDLLAPYQPFVEALRHYLAAWPATELEDQLGARRALLAQLLPELGERSHRSDGPSSRGESGSERYALFDAVASLLREAARMRPTVLVLDDLHWADAATMLLARHVAASAGDAPLLLLGAYRGVERGEALAAALADFRRARRLTSVSLAGLSAVEVAALAHGQGSRLGEDALRAVAERTGGNPFFAEEVVRQLEADGSSAVPESVKDLLGRRMRGLHESVCGALAAAAVLGGEFEFAVLQRATEVEPEALLDALDCALAEHVITEPPGRAGRYAFAHALIRETIYDELSRGRRARLHARAGAAIRALHAGSLEERAAELAHHFQRAGDDVAGFEFARLAGRAAARVHASDVAIGHYSAALEAAARLGLSAHEDERVRGLLIERGWRRHVHGDFEAAIADYGRALDAARAAGDRRLEAEALDQIGYAEKLFDIERAREHHRAALAIADELQDVPLQVGILSRLSLVLSNQLDLAGALAVGERALALARDGGGKADRGPAIDALKQAALQLGDLDRLGRLTAELEEAERASGDLWYLQWTLLEAAFVPLGRARYEEAAARLDDALAISRRIGDSTARPLIHDARCWLERSRGRYDRALAEGRRAVELSAPGGGGPWSAWTRATLGWCLLEVRAVSEAISVLEQGHGHAELLADRYRTAAHLAWARTLAGDRDGALDAIAAAARARDALTVPAGSAYLFGFGATVALARAQLASGAADDALAAIEPLPSVAREAGWHEAEAAASLAIGLCHADRDVDRADRALREAVALARRHALPGVEWEAIGALAALAGGAEATELRAQSAAIAGRLAAGIDDDGLAAGLAQVSQR